MTTLLDNLLDETGACCSDCASGTETCGHGDSELEDEGFGLDFGDSLELESSAVRVPIPDASCSKGPTGPRQGCFYRVREGDNLFVTPQRTGFDSDVRSLQSSVARLCQGRHSRSPYAGSTDWSAIWQAIHDATADEIETRGGVSPEFPAAFVEEVIAELLGDE